jgi:hypothetical protein
MMQFDLLGGIALTGPALLGALALLALIDSTSFGTLLIPIWLMLVPGRLRRSRILIYLATVAGFYLLVGLLLLTVATFALPQLEALASTAPFLWVQLIVGAAMLIGPGAGAGPTASSVMSDLIDIARGHVLVPFGASAKDLKPYKKAQMRTHEGGYYIRLSVYDRTGAFAAIAGRMAEQGISLESIVQRLPYTEMPGAHRRREGSAAAVVMITHQTTEAAIRKALQAIERDGNVVAKPQMIRIEKL